MHIWIPSKRTLDFAIPTQRPHVRPIHHSLARRMLVLILLGAGLVVWLVLGYGYFAQRQMLLDHAAREGGALAQAVASQIEATLGRAEATVRQTGLTLDGKDMRRAGSTDLIRRTLEALSLIHI